MCNASLRALKTAGKGSGRILHFRKIFYAFVLLIFHHYYVSKTIAGYALGVASL